MKPEIRAAIKDIQGDRNEGVRRLALNGLLALRSVAADCDGEELRDNCRRLALARPMNATIENAVAAAWARYIETNNAEAAIDDTIEAIENAPEEMALSASKVVPTGTLLTLSYSSTVIDLLPRLKPHKVIVSETRPSNEGIRVAKALVHAGISVTLITEAQMALFAHEADTIVTGADMILPEGDFINRIGTRLLALAARDAEVPFYVIADTLKIAAPSEPKPFAPQEGKAKEICDETWLEVRNVYYELTPSRLVTGFVTEHGVLDPSGIQQYSTENERHWQALMNSHEL